MADYTAPAPFQEPVDPALTYPPWSHHVRPHAFDAAGEWRAEIEARTNAGESCKQIAAALKAKGIDVSDKTISKRRVSWGLRKRASPSTKGTIRPNMRVPRPNRRKDPNVTSTRNNVHCKEVVTRLTNEGKTADEIYEALVSQGMTFGKGVASVWRLQTFWKLIPYDKQRARGTGPYKKGSKAATAKKQAEVGSRVVDYHYPPDCAHGPQRNARSKAAAQHEVPEHLRSGPIEESIQIDSDPDSDDEPYNVQPSLSPVQQFTSDHTSHHRRLAPGPKPPSQPPPQIQTFTTVASHSSNESPARNPAQHSYTAAEVQQADAMAANLLVDLANSALEAASKLKELMLAAQQKRPAAGSLSGVPPTPAEILAWRRKVKEAAGMVVDLVGGGG